ncbi:hypothetical protein SLE2022_250170 [Rubroshorea leprosula]
MIPNGRGNIINTASIASTFGGAASYAYTSSKHGMLGLQDRKLKHEMVCSGVNAFGIISLSSGLDLSGLFTGEKRTEKRYSSTASVERVVERVMRGVGERLGYKKWKWKKGSCGFGEREGGAGVGGSGDSEVVLVGGGGAGEG